MIDRIVDNAIVPVMMPSDHEIGNLPPKASLSQTILNGDSYFGRTFVVDQWYVAMYTPLRGPSGEIIGMLGTALSETAGVNRLGESLKLLVFCRSLWTRSTSISLTTSKFSR